MNVYSSFDREFRDPRLFRCSLENSADQLSLEQTISQSRGLCGAHREKGGRRVSRAMRSETDFAGKRGLESTSPREEFNGAPSVPVRGERKHKPFPRCLPENYSPAFFLAFFPLPRPRSSLPFDYRGTSINGVVSRGLCRVRVLVTLGLDLLECTLKCRADAGDFYRSLAVKFRDE